MGYASVAFKGISWMSGLQLTIRLFSLLKIAILARILSPAQFGIFGIASLVLAFLEILTETGVNVILIQSQKGLHKYIDSAWVVSIIRGIIISLLMIILTPLIALFFNTPDVTSLLLFISLIPFVRGFINPAIITFQKELAFHKEFSLRTLLVFVETSVTVILTILSHSLYSLVWGLLAAAVTEVILSFVLIKPRPRFAIQSEYLKEIFHKGKWVTLYGILDYFAKNGDNLVIGKMLGPGPLGIYQAAYRIATLTFTEITEVINKVFFPFFSKLSQEKDRLKMVFRITMIALCCIVIPLSILIGFFSKEVVLLFLGEKWLQAADILSILAIYGMLRALVGYPTSFLLGLEKQHIVTYMTLVRALGLGITVIPLITVFGLVGGAYAAIISIIVEIPVVWYALQKALRKE